MFKLAAELIEDEYSGFEELCEMLRACQDKIVVVKKDDKWIVRKLQMGGYRYKGKWYVQSNPS